MMDKLFATAVLIGVMLGASLGADEAPRPVGGDLDRLQGRWTTQAGPKRDIAVVLEIEGHQVRVTIEPPRAQFAIRARGEMVLDETAEPRALDWVNIQMLDGQPLPDILAIYTIDAETWTVRTGGFTDGRPAVFQPGDGVLADVLTFQRVADDAPDHPPTADEPNRSSE